MGSSSESPAHGSPPHTRAGHGGLLAELMAVRMVQCVMGCEASNIPISPCFPSCHHGREQLLPPTSTSLPAATFSYSAGTVRLRLLPHASTGQLATAILK